MQASYVEPNTVILTLDGEFDALAAIDVRPVLESIVATGNSDVVVDFSNVDFLDSSGIGCMVFLFKRLHAAKRTLTLRGLHGQPQRLVRSLRIDRAIPTLPAGAVA